MSASPPPPSTSTGSGLMALARFLGAGLAGEALSSSSALSSASTPSGSVGSGLMDLARFLGAGLVGRASSSSSAASPLVAGALALGFLAEVPAGLLLTVAPPRSFFLMERKQVLADAAVL